MTIDDFKRACEDKNDPYDMINAIDDMSVRYGYNLAKECENCNVAAEYFDTENYSSREFGRFTIYTEPDENSNELLDDNGKVYAKEEHEILITVFANYIDAGSDDIYYTYGIWDNGDML